LIPTATPTLTSTPAPTVTLTPTLTSQPVATSGPAPTFTATAEPPLLAFADRNADWQPDIREVNGVPMAVVPAGCFIMGSEGYDEDESPAHEICFEEPYLIDIYEVTNAQYGSEGFFGGGERPRDTVTYAQAAAHCAERGARLPTEAEWEYAARGPDSLTFPWGNAFDPGNVVYVQMSLSETADVGSREGGVSWVGAHDMVGNLWEWTSTIYGYSYPYTPDDGREDPDDVENFRVIRGGAYSTDVEFVRAASRKQKHPSLEWYGYVGFRCARDAAVP
jgi:formylglycine-generating enzyme required for sulfatase activity